MRSCVPSAPHRAFHYGWVVVAMGTLTVFGALGLARFGYSALLPSMQQSLGMDNTQAGLLATANLAGYLVLAATGGALASRHGPRTVAAAGLAVVGVGMLLTGCARTPGEAALWRTVTGFGSGASNVPAMGLLAAWAATRRRGVVTGIGVAGSSLALMAVGPTVPRILASGGPEGWRTCWFGFGSIALLLAAGAAALLRNRPSDLGLEPLGARPDDLPATPRAQALEWRRVYRSPAVWHLGAVYVAFGFSYIIYLTFFVKRLVGEGGWTPPQAGRLFMLMGGCSLVSGIAWGGLSDRIGRRRTLVAVYLLHAVSFGLFAVQGHDAALRASAVLFGLCAWSIPAIMAATCGDLLGPSLAPSALGFVTLFFGIGQAAAPGVAGAVADAAGGFGPVFLLAAGVALLGALLAAGLRSGGVGPGNEEPPRT